MMCNITHQHIIKVSQQPQFDVIEKLSCNVPKSTSLVMQTVHNDLNV